jgi:hypothetical protein
MKMTKRITITYSHPIDSRTGRPGRLRANFLGHDDRARDFLFKNVRRYRGPNHPFVTPPYAQKIEALAAAAGIKVTVVKRPKPTPVECKAAIKAAFENIHRRWTVSP